MKKMLLQGGNKTEYLVLRELVYEICSRFFRQSFRNGGLRIFLFARMRAKLRRDVPVLKALPQGAVEIVSWNGYPDQKTIGIEVAGQTIEIGGSR